MFGTAGGSLFGVNNPNPTFGFNNPAAKQEEEKKQEGATNTNQTAGLFGDKNKLPIPVAGAPTVLFSGPGLFGTQNAPNFSSAPPA